MGGMARVVRGQVMSIKTSICNSNPDTWIFHFPHTLGISFKRWAFVVITVSNLQFLLRIEFFGNWCPATDSQLGHNDWIIINF